MAAPKLRYPSPPLSGYEERRHRDRYPKHRAADEATGEIPAEDLPSGQGRGVLSGEDRRLVSAS
jgi:hypothetical protein